VIGIDTNVQARYFEADKDHREQTRLARVTIDTAFNRSEAIFISNIALFETVWVLLRSFKVKKEAILRALDWVLSQPLFKLEAHSAVAEATDQYRQSNADFSDLLIVGSCAAAGCSVTYTFDKTASKLEGFSLLEQT